ncbi:snRNA-activating protein complex subunit 4 [Pogona vitticeps]
MDINAEREKIRQEIEELERCLGPSVSNLEVAESGSSLESGSEDEDDLEDDDSGTNTYIDLEVYPGESDEAMGEEEAEASVPLPQTPETCLQMNLVYQEVLQEKIEEVKFLLAQNREQQEKLTWELAGARGSQSSSRKTLPANMFLGHFMKPYFKDKASGIGPPANSEAREKARQGIKSFEELITVKWKSREKQLLHQAVMSDRLQRLLQPKLMNLEYLNEKRAKCRNEMDQQIVDKQIQEKEREINDINLLPEESLLGNRYDEHDWDKIANINFEGTRSATELRRYWQNSEHPSISKKEWSEDEIEKLKDIATRRNCVDWEAIAEELGTQRTAFQCLQTFQASNRDLRRSEWSPEEDQMLLQLIQEMRIGKHIPYRKIAYYMEGRDSAQLLYRWTKRVDPKLKRGAWTPAEDALLLKAIKKYGERDWYKIRAEVPGRSDVQCRDRYLHALHHDIKKGKWSPEEETRLVELTEKYGVGRWAKIASELPHRSGGQCLSKWKIMLGYRRNVKKKEEASLQKKRKRVQRASPCLSETSSEDSDLELVEDSGEEEEALKARKEKGAGRWRVPGLDLWIPTKRNLSERKPGKLAAVPSLSKGFNVNRKRRLAPGAFLDQDEGQGAADPAQGPSEISQPTRPKGPKESAQKNHQNSRTAKDTWRVSLAYVKSVLRNNSYKLQRRTRELRRRKRFAVGSEAGGGQALASGPHNGAHPGPGKKDGMWKTTLYRRLMMAVTPWTGTQVQRWALRVKTEASRKTKADFISKHLQSAHLTSRPLFTLFIQLLHIDVDGCMGVIEKRKTREAELLRSVVGNPAKDKQVRPPPSYPFRASLVAAEIAGTSVPEETAVAGDGGRERSFIIIILGWQSWKRGPCGIIQSSPCPGGTHRGLKPATREVSLPETQKPAGQFRRFRKTFCSNGKMDLGCRSARAELLFKKWLFPSSVFQVSSAPNAKARLGPPAAGPPPGKKLIPLKAKEGPVPGGATWEAVPYRSAPKPKTVSELLREKRLRAAKAAQQRKLFLVPPLILSPTVVVAPQRGTAMPGAGGPPRAIPANPQAGPLPGLPRLPPSRPAVPPQAGGLASSGEAPGASRGPVLARRLGTEGPAGSGRQEGETRGAQEPPLLPARAPPPPQRPTTGLPGPSASPGALGAGSSVKGTLGSSSGAQGPPEKNPGHASPAAVASPGVPKPILPVTLILTSQGLLPLTIVRLPGQGGPPPSGPRHAPSLDQAAPASGAHSGKGASSGGPPSSPVPPANGPPAARLSAPPRRAPPSEGAQPRTAPTVPVQTGAPRDQAAGSAPPTVAGGSPRPAGPSSPRSHPALPEEKLSPDYRLLSLEDGPAVKAWAQGASGGGPLALGPRLPYLPPFLCSLKALSSLLLKKESLVRGAASLLTSGGRLGETAPPPDPEESLRALVRGRLRDNPAYLLLKRRFLAAFTFPAALAALPPYRVATTLSGGRWWESRSGEDSSSSEEEEEEEEGVEGDEESRGAAGNGPSRGVVPPRGQEGHPWEPEVFPAQAPAAERTASEPPSRLGTRSSSRLRKKRMQP